jgi:hypothetical protein
MQVKSQIMDKAQMERSVHRMAHEIIEQNRDVKRSVSWEPQPGSTFGRQAFQLSETD